MEHVSVLFPNYDRETRLRGETTNSNKYYTNY